MFRQEGVCHRTQATSIYHVLIIRKHLDGLSNPSVHPHRSYRTLRDGSLAVRCPRHFVPGYDRAVPPGHLPVVLTPPYAHGTAPISDQIVSYTCGAGTLRACVPGVRVGLRSLPPRRSFDLREISQQALTSLVTGFALISVVCHPSDVRLSREGMRIKASRKGT